MKARYRILALIICLAAVLSVVWPQSVQAGGEFQTIPTMPGRTTTPRGSTNTPQPQITNTPQPQSSQTPGSGGGATNTPVLPTSTLILFTQTPSATPTAGPSPTPSATPTFGASPTASASPTFGPSPTPGEAFTSTPSVTPGASPTLSGTADATLTTQQITETAVLAGSNALTPTLTPTASGDAGGGTGILVGLLVSLSILGLGFLGLRAIMAARK